MPNNGYDLTIVGAGILGTAIAGLTSAAGWNTLCIRRSDAGRPKADTLRNQGWLQSGLLYRLEDFLNDDQYEAFASRTYFAGRHLLQSCSLPVTSAGGIVGCSNMKRVDELRRKASLLRLGDNEFHELGRDEARSALGHLHKEEATYFRIPDVPFDGAAVLSRLRNQAERTGAKFIDTSSPVTLEPAGSSTRLRFDSHAIESPLTFIAAGTGSVLLLRQLGHELPCEVRRTPLLVSHAPCFLPAPIYVDQDRGFSAVRHCCGPGELATVVGTRAYLQPVVAVMPEHRFVSKTERLAVQRCVHPNLLEELGRGRITAGEELIPKTRSLTQFEPWVEDFGNVVFGSPGRATVTMLAAVEVMARLRTKRPGRAGLFSLDSTRLKDWTAPISMHFTRSYDFDDSENSR